MQRDVCEKPSSACLKEACKAAGPESWRDRHSKIRDRSELRGAGEGLYPLTSWKE